MGAGSSNLMAISSLVQAGSSYATASSQASAMKMQGAYEKNQAERNARLSDLQAKDATERGAKEANAIKRAAAKVKGEQRVAAAASGIKVDSGVSADLQDETDLMSEIDMLTVKNNAWREAWGHRVQALDYRGQGKQAELMARFGSKQTLLVGGLEALRHTSQGLAHYERGQEKKIEKVDFSNEPMKIGSRSKPKYKDERSKIYPSDYDGYYSSVRDSKKRGR